MTCRAQADGRTNPSSVEVARAVVTDWAKVTGGRRPSVHWLYDAEREDLEQRIAAALEHTERAALHSLIVANALHPPPAVWRGETHGDGSPCGVHPVSAKCFTEAWAALRDPWRCRHGLTSLMTCVKCGRQVSWWRNP